MIKLAYHSHIVRRECEVEYIEVLAHALDFDRLRDDYDAELEEEAKRHMCNALAAFLTYRSQIGICKKNR